MNTFEDNQLLLQSTITDMISDIKDNILTREDEQNDLMFVEFYFSKLHPEMIARNVIKKVLPYKNAIEKRDEGFFKQNKFIFSGLDDSKYAYYENIFSDSTRMNVQDKQILWDYFDTLILLAERIKKND